MQMLRHYCLTGFFIVFTFFSYGQQKYSIEKGGINFTSNAQLELIKASSDKVQGLLDPTTNQFAFTVDIKSFQGFNSALQREHFNEKYMESDKFPKATFQGKIEGYDKNSGTQSAKAIGKLTIHGVTNDVEIPGTITKQGSKLQMKSKFIVKLANYNIAIPQLLWQNIAEQVEVTAEFGFKPQ